MKTSIRRMGNSRGVLIPKLTLAQTGMDLGGVEIECDRSRSEVVRRGENSRSKLVTRHLHNRWRHSV